MAITVLAKPSILGNGAGYALAFGVIPGPASYATGGFSADPVTDFGITEYTVQQILVFGSGGYMADFDPTTKKIKVYSTNTTTGLPTEIAAGTDLSNVDFTIFAIYV